MKFSSWRSKVSNILFIAFIILLLIPTTRKSIQVFANGLLSFAPKVLKENDQVKLSSFNWKLKGVNTPDFNLDLNRGEVTLVNLWATWCPPCIAEMPSFQNLYNQYGDQVQFVFISNEDPKIINAFLHSNNYNLPVYNPLEVGPTELYNKSLPTTYLIDKKGFIILKKVGAADWDHSNMINIIENVL